MANLPFGPTAGITCYDLRFPGLWMELSNRGAEIVIVPAAWPAARREHWQLLTSARAVEHQLFVIACNAAGTQEGVELGGHSRVVDPTGRVLAEAGAGESVLMVDIDPAQAGTVRTEFPVIKDRLANYQTLAR
ncbi:nitrilase-related carbon-nitrogen hydrolase [Paenarthrobacter sp. S56]|uniref:nitrilase-related carbon-nitrogen hydrolase n=1 Tax=Paenarthrobacter sp. S56 TaxID=3138179 RepID=UPI003219624C